jgi:hypothetical protein
MRKTVATAVFLVACAGNAQAQQPTLVEWGLLPGVEPRSVCVYDYSPSPICVPIGTLNSGTHVFAPLISSGSVTSSMLAPGAAAANLAAAPALITGTQSPALAMSYTGAVPVPAGYQTIGPLFNITNNGSAVGYGGRFNFYSYATASGFELANSVIMVVRATTGINHTSYMSRWDVNVCPNDAVDGFACQIAEINPVNRGLDLGWSNNLSTMQQWYGGVRMVPESSTFGEAGTGRNVTFGFSIAHSGAVNTDGNYAKTYTGFMAEADSIGPGGRAAELMGDTTGNTVNYPYTPLQIDKTFSHGVNLQNALFIDNVAINLATGQRLQWAAAGVSVAGAPGPSVSGSGSFVSLNGADGGSGLRVTAAPVVISSDLSTWSSTSGATITNNVATAPDGTATAAKLTQTATNVAQSIFKTFAGASGNTYTAVVYVKPAAGTAFNNVSIALTNTGFAGKHKGAVVNSSTCTYVNGLFGTDFSDSYAVTPVANGYCRVAVTAVSTAGSPWVIELSSIGGVSGTNTTFPGDGSSGFYAWGLSLTTNSSNIPVVAPSISGLPVTLSAAQESTDANVSISLAPKGAGTVQIASGGVQLPATTVGALATCTAALAGTIYYVTDASAPAYNVALTGGGAVKTLAMCNGAAWTAH